MPLWQRTSSNRDLHSKETEFRTNRMSRINGQLKTHFYPALSRICNFNPLDCCPVVYRLRDSRCVDKKLLQMHFNIFVYILIIANCAVTQHVEKGGHEHAVSVRKHALKMLSKCLTLQTELLINFK